MRKKEKLLADQRKEGNDARWCIALVMRQRSENAVFCRFEWLALVWELAFFIERGKTVQEVTTMVQISCGCKREHPGSTCERGKQLFAAVDRAAQVLIDRTATDEQWAIYTCAYLAYIDHLRGWQEGDVKVQRRMDAWMLSIRFCGRWMLHFATQDEDLVREWLALRGYQQFVGKGQYATDRLSGYYRKTEMGVVVQEQMSLLRLPEPIDEADLSVFHTGRLTERKITPDITSSPDVDLKTLVTVYIALLVAHIPHSLTVVDRLFVQRRAANLLRVHGVQIGPRDERMLQTLIDEAVRQKEQMSPSTRNTQTLEE
jgi:hypothetical protein